MGDSDDPQPRPGAPAGAGVDLTGFEGTLRQTGGPADEAAETLPTDTGQDATVEVEAVAGDETVAPRPQVAQPDEQPADPRNPPSSLDALELRLSIRLGETLMSIADLRQAGPGTVLTLDRPDGSLVDIIANGQPIGTGEIISVSGQRAVEIRTLFGDG